MLREEKYSGSSKLAYFFSARVDMLFFFMRGAGLCQYWSTRGLKKLDPDLCPYIIYSITTMTKTGVWKNACWLARTIIWVRMGYVMNSFATNANVFFEIRKTFMNFNDKYYFIKTCFGSHSNHYQWFSVRVLTQARFGLSSIPLLILQTFFSVIA